MSLDICTSARDLLRPWIGYEIGLREKTATTLVEGHLFVEIWPVAFRPIGEKDG